MDKIDGAYTLEEFKRMREEGYQKFLQKVRKSGDYTQIGLLFGNDHGQDKDEELTQWN